MLSRVCSLGTHLCFALITLDRKPTGGASSSALATRQSLGTRCSFAGCGCAFAASQSGQREREPLFETSTIGAEIAVPAIFNCFKLLRCLHYSVASKL